MSSPFRPGSLADREYQANASGIRHLAAGLLFVFLVAVLALLALRVCDRARRSKVQGPAAKVNFAPHILNDTTHRGALFASGSCQDAQDRYPAQASDAVRYAGGLVPAATAAMPSGHFQSAGRHDVPRGRFTDRLKAGLQPAEADLDRELDRLTELQLRYRSLPIRQRMALRPALERQLARVAALQRQLLKGTRA